MSEVWPPLQKVMDEARRVPNPGSDEAGKLGCTCAVLDNEYGRGFPWPRTDGRDPTEFPSFWVSEDCPIHGTGSEWVNP